MWSARGSDVDLHQVERTQQTQTVEPVTLCVYFYAQPPSRGDRTVAPAEHISKPGGLRPLIHDLHLLWPYHLERLLKRYSSHSHALTGGPMAVYHPGAAAAAERFEAGRW